MELIIGRPTSREAISAARAALAREDIHEPPSLRLGVDVQQIMRQQVFLREKTLNDPKK